jgi:hypothetical protein
VTILDDDAMTCCSTFEKDCSQAARSLLLLQCNIISNVVRCMIVINDMVCDDLRQLVWCCLNRERVVALISFRRLRSLHNLSGI